MKHQENKQLKTNKSVFYASSDRVKIVQALIMVWCFYLHYEVPSKWLWKYIIHPIRDMTDSTSQSKSQYKWNKKHCFHSSAPTYGNPALKVFLMSSQISEKRFNVTLILYTLRSVCMFSILFSVQFLRCWQGEFVQQSIISFLFLTSIFNWRVIYYGKKLDVGHSYKVKGLRQQLGSWFCFSHHCCT